MRERSLRQHRGLVPLRLQERIRRVPQTQPLCGRVGRTGPEQNRPTPQHIPLKWVRKDKLYRTQIVQNRVWFWILKQIQH